MKYLSTKELAEITGLAVNTVRDKIRKLKIGSYGHRRYDPDEFLRAIRVERKKEDEPKPIKYKKPKYTAEMQKDYDEIFGGI